MATTTPFPQNDRRSPAAKELRVFRAYIETADQLRSSLGARLQGESGVSTGDYAVLLALSEAPDHRMRSSDLAAQIGWERSRLSHHLGRMEHRGLICREECLTDSRGADVTLAAAGSDAYRRANVPHLRAIRELFIDALSPAQLVAALDIAEALRDHRPAGSNSERR